LFFNIDQLEKLLVVLENVWIGLLTDFTFKFFPIVGSYILSILFYMFLGSNPVFKA